jgi:GT2 family glycosyltransferase
MELSFLIVTKNRPDDLVFTLNKLKNLIDVSIHEVLVFIDGCFQTEKIVGTFDWVNWTISKKSISASPARNILYKKAKGTIFIGLDDDAHPVSSDFISSIKSEFELNESLGIIAFQEIRGLYESDNDTLKQTKQHQSYLTNDFVGCGFAISKNVYYATNGFPVWMDIYGEESALALEVLDLGFDIKYNSSIMVNHRVDVEKRKLQGRNYYRFERQLKNSMKYYLIYYKNPIFKIVKLLIHNFKKYALSDIRYFKLFFKAFFTVLFNMFDVLKYRKPVSQSTIHKKVNLQLLTY